MIVVPNPSLLDNHQVDLASELDKLGHLSTSSVKWVITFALSYVCNVMYLIPLLHLRRTLAQDVANFESSKLVPFPAMDPSRFRSILDEEMGFL